MFCQKCGKQIEEGVSFCPACGTRIGAAVGNHSTAAPQPVVVNVVNNNTNQNVNKHSSSSYPQKSKWTAFFLCLFLGMLGIHRFYVGKSGTGLIWLFTGGFFAIGWVIDLLLILFGSFRDKAGYPLG